MCKVTHKMKIYTQLIFMTTFSFSLLSFIFGRVLGVDQNEDIILMGRVVLILFSLFVVIFLYRIHLDQKVTRLHSRYENGI